MILQTSTMRGDGPRQHAVTNIFLQENSMETRLNDDWRVRRSADSCHRSGDCCHTLTTLTCYEDNLVASLPYIPRPLAPSYPRLVSTKPSSFETLHCSPTNYTHRSPSMLVCVCPKKGFTKQQPLRCPPSPSLPDERTKIFPERQFFGKNPDISLTARHQSDEDFSRKTSEDDVI